MRSADVYCAPNTGGESFGIVLVEAMAAGTAVVASDLDAFRRVLEDGTAGRLVPVDDSDGAGRGARSRCSPTTSRAERYVEAAAKAVRRYDWSVVAREILRVYETVAGAGAKVRVAGTAGNGSPPEAESRWARQEAARASEGRRPTSGWGDGVITWLVVVALALLAVVLLIGGIWAFQTAHRLDRLHVRYDLSWQALDGILARRAVVARAVATDAYGNGAAGRQLAALADAAERAPRNAREAAENELSTALAAVDPASLPVALVAEMADAEARVLLGRRFHNDAVRDTLALRERPLVRWLHLGGTAAMPTLFRDRRTGGAALRRPAGLQAHVGAHRPARRARIRAAVLRFRSGHASPRRAGGSPSAARSSRARPCPTPPCANSPRRRVCASAGPTWSVRCGGATPCSTSTVR